MPYLPGYTNDIFVSYSLTNDDVTLDGADWVRTFEDQLRRSIRNRLLKNGKDLKTYYAGRDLRHDQDIDVCLSELKTSALFLIIGSPRYLCDEWPQKELETFRAIDPKLDRVFVAEFLPLPDGMSYPGKLDGRFRAPFWRRTERGAAINFSEINEAFQNRLADLARDIAERLEAMNGAGPPRAPARIQNSDHRPVLLAQVTEDLEDLSYGMRTYLEQFDVPVLPLNPFPQGGAEFAEAFATCLDASEIVVQLLGPFPGRRPPDLPEGYAAHQAAAALALPGKDLLQWRAVDLNPEAVADPAHRQLLSGPHVDAMLFERFKEMVHQRATAPRRPAAEQSPETSFIFINAAEVDEDRAKKVLAECRRMRRAAVMPAFGSDTKREWVENYRQTGKVVLLHSKSDPGWLNVQLRLFTNTLAKRKSRPATGVIYLAPPRTEDDLTATHPDFEIIEAPNGDLDTLYERLF